MIFIYLKVINIAMRKFHKYINTLHTEDGGPKDKLVFARDFKPLKSLL